MLGHVVALYLKENGHRVTTLSASNALDDETRLVDVRNLKALDAVLGAANYVAVVNCIGLLVKESEQRQDLAVFVNSYLPHYLETYYSNSKTKVINISTNCVFEPDLKGYAEGSLRNGSSFYARSKALGEVLNNKDLTFRMSLVGPDLKEDGTGLFNWFYHQHGEVPGYANTLWNGITSLQLAKAIPDAIQQNLTGIYHLVPKDSTSKYKLLQIFREAFGRTDIDVVSKEGPEVGTLLINTRKDFDFPIPDYATMVREMKDWINTHPNLYSHYV